MGNRSIGPKLGSILSVGARHSWLFVAIAMVLIGCRMSSPVSPLDDIEQRSVFPAEKAPPQGYGDPARIGAEDAWFTAPDNTRLHGLFFPHPQPRAIILYAHGNGGNVGIWSDVARQLHDRHNVAVLVFDYRGYGRSEGTPSEEGVLMDARAARAWLARRTSVAEKDVVLMGRSLGGGVAVDLAANDGARALILQSTFSSLRKAAASHVPIAPALMKYRFDSLAKIAKFHGPVLISHGDADRVIPFEQGRQLFAAANEPKQFFTVAHGDHNDPEPDEYHRALDEFLGQLK